MKKIYGFLAFMGVWVAFCSIADYVIDFESISYAMAFGYLAGLVADKAQKWIEE